MPGHSTKAVLLTSAADGVTYPRDWTQYCMTTTHELYVKVVHLCQNGVQIFAVLGEVQCGSKHIDSSLLKCNS